MKAIAFCTTFWDDDPKLAEAKATELNGWVDRAERYFHPGGMFLATGCQDDPRLNPVRDRVSCVVPSGEPKTKPYDVFRWSYFLCAFEAALWKVTLNAQRWAGPWDLLVEMESNVWINPKVDVGALLSTFLMRDELILAPSWFGRPDFNLLIMKPAAVPAFLHHRLRGNLVDHDKPCPMLAEDELGEIFKGRWWNPWPDLMICRQQWGIPENPPDWRVTEDEVAKDWPVVALASPEIQRLFSL